MASILIIQKALGHRLIKKVWFSSSRTSPLPHGEVLNSSMDVCLLRHGWICQHKRLLQPINIMIMGRITGHDGVSYGLISTTHYAPPACLSAVLHHESCDESVFAMFCPWRVAG